MQKKSRWVLCAFAIAALLAWSGCSNSSNVPANNSLMWVATQGDQLVRTFTINQENGSINPVGNSKGNPAATGVQPVQMAITPDGKTMFIVNSGANGTSGSITSYTFNGDGSLKAAGAGVAAGETPIALAIDPGGKFLFVANQGTSGDPASGTVSVFSVSGASLAEVAGSPFPTEVTGDVTGTGPTAVAVSPVGNYLYVANVFSNTVQSFAYDSSSGALTLIASYAAGTNPAGLAFSRCAGITASTATGSCPAADGNHLFVTNSGSNNISVFVACIQISGTCSSPNGTLTPIASGSPFAAGVGPAMIFTDPTSDYVYAVDRGSSQVSEYQYSPVTGALTTLASGSGGASVFAGAITQNVSNTTSTSNWVVVTNNGASSLSVFRVAVTGKLIGLSSGPYQIQGQPSAILLR
ncbi:MAG TPA: beta-propeller fold lactonase family protein [Terriglobales bacterium]|nr:beta-propeller fold lactonase family protein [Terriglobales bacterium]